jgi:hypothetical protein
MVVTQDFSFFNSWNDPQQIRLLEDRLPTELTYEGEFGTEIVTFVPFIFNLYLRGILEKRKVSTYSGMSPYYYFLKSRNLIETPKNRSFVPKEQRWWPNSNEHQRIPILGEFYPKFEKSQSKRDVLFIQNKYCVEWDEGPINYLSINTLGKIFEETKGKCRVIYTRQGIFSRDTKLGISIDHNTELSFEDLALCDKYKHVKVLEKRSFENFRSYNAGKFHWISKAFLLLGIQGGSSYPWAYFN